MILFFTLAVLSAVTVGSVVAYQRGAMRRLTGGEARKALPAHEPQAAVERTLDTLRPGDVIVEGDDDWLIVGTLTYREERDVWWLHRAQGGDGHRLFEVRQRQELTAAWLLPAADVPAHGQLYDGLTHRGLPFRLSRRGDARVSSDGDVGSFAEGLLRYATYEGPGGLFLNIEEREGVARSALSGERVVAEGLMLMPGERPEVDEPLPPDTPPTEGV
jgi:hypothetical protein